MQKSSASSRTTCVRRTLPGPTPPPRGRGPRNKMIHVRHADDVGGRPDAANARARHGARWAHRLRSAERRRLRLHGQGRRAPLRRPDPRTGRLADLVVSRAASRTGGSYCRTGGCDDLGYYAGGPRGTRPPRRMPRAGQARRRSAARPAISARRASNIHSDARGREPRGGKVAGISL